MFYIEKSIKIKIPFLYCSTLNCHRQNQIIFHFQMKWKMIWWLPMRYIWHEKLIWKKVFLAKVYSFKKKVLDFILNLISNCSNSYCLFLRKLNNVNMAIISDVYNLFVLALWTFLSQFKLSIYWSIDRSIERERERDRQRERQKEREKIVCVLQNWKTIMLIAFLSEPE